MEGTVRSGLVEPEVSDEEEESSLVAVLKSSAAAFAVRGAFNNDEPHESRAGGEAGGREEVLPIDAILLMSWQEWVCEEAPCWKSIWLEEKEEVEEAESQRKDPLEPKEKHISV